jgi:hypothetical protein
MFVKRYHIKDFAKDFAITYTDQILLTFKFLYLTLFPIQSS